MSGNFQLAIADHEKMLQELYAEQSRKQKIAEDSARAKAQSRQATMLFLERFVDQQIKTGGLNSTHVETYLTQIRKEYGDQAMIGKYVSIVVRLLSHDFYGVESTTHRPGNGGLIYKGESYKNSKELYEYFVEFMAAFDPFDSQVWFDYILLETFVDPTKLPAEVLLPDYLKLIVPQLQKLVEQDKNSMNVPELSSITTDDAFIIQGLFGGF
ncbi:hypothetical protein [Nostoc sp. JL33]|uniref:hypothetical protein n=1 Tax=Nostoc sp. JL33 TaxID=2815396 RepID=UPI0025EF76CC|nr:hypothetical protein [Nostoc sp. JL33]MBN3872293.1 hypothetical protein [Nostoc sp. JL33]